MKLSISDMARMVGKSDRTISRWLQEGGPLANAQRLEDGRYEIAESLLLAQMPQSTDVMILERLRAIEEQLAAIREQLARAGPPTQQEKQIAPPAQPRPERPVPALTITPAALPEMPEGQEIATVFAGRHLPGYTGDQIARLIQTLREGSWAVPMIPGRYKMGKATAKWALDAAGREAFYNAIRERPGFKPCLSCPHPQSGLTESEESNGE
jgi:hypothetical protein